jgi:hypothetical protein
MKRFNRVKKLYEQNILKDICKTADLRDKLLGNDPVKEEEPSEKEEEKYVEPKIPHRVKVDKPQLTLFPEKPIGTKEEPSKFTSGEVMGRICPVCGLKNFPVWKTECERCAKIYDRINKLIEYHGFTAEEAQKLVAKENRSFLGPTAIKQIYENKGEIDLPEEVEEIDFRDPRGLAGTPNFIKLKNILDTRFNIKKDRFGEPIFDEDGLPIPLDKIEKLHFSMDELTKKLLLDNKSFSNYIFDYNKNKPEKERIGPSFKLSDDLQIFHWLEIKPAFEERLKELREEILPQKHVERLHQKSDKIINRIKDAKREIKYWEEKQQDLKKAYSLLNKPMFDKFKTLQELRKFKINNKKRKNLENSIGKELDKYIEKATRFLDNKNAINSRIDKNKEELRETMDKLISFRNKIGKPIPEEVLTLSKVEEDEESLDMNQLKKDLLGKLSRTNILHFLLKESAKPYQTSLFGEEPSKEEEKRKREKREREEEQFKGFTEKELDIYTKEELEDLEEERTRFVPRKPTWFPPKEQEPRDFTKRVCPYCNKGEILEGSTICSKCKFPAEENPKYIVIETATKRFPTYSLVSIETNYKGKPQWASVRKISRITPDMSSKTEEERIELRKKGPMFNAPGALSNEFRTTPTGKRVHKQQARNAPPPWKKIPRSEFPKYKQTEAAYAHVTGEPLPEGTKAWNLKDVANVKEPDIKLPFVQGPTILPTSSTRLERIYIISKLD